MRGYFLSRLAILKLGAIPRRAHSQPSPSVSLVKTLVWPLSHMFFLFKSVFAWVLARVFLFMMNVCVCGCGWVGGCLCVCLSYIHTYIHTYIHACMHAYTYKHTCIPIYTHKKRGKSKEKHTHPVMKLKDRTRGPFPNALMPLSLLPSISAVAMSTSVST